MPISLPHLFTLWCAASACYMPPTDLLAHQTTVCRPLATIPSLCLSHPATGPVTEPSICPTNINCPVTWSQALWGKVVLSGASWLRARRLPVNQLRGEGQSVCESECGVWGGQWGYRVFSRADGKWQVLSGVGQEATNRTEGMRGKWCKRQSHNRPDKCLLYTRSLGPQGRSQELPWDSRVWGFGKDLPLPPSRAPAVWVCLCHKG